MVVCIRDQCHSCGAGARKRRVEEDMHNTFAEYHHQHPVRMLSHQRLVAVFCHPLSCRGLVFWKKKFKDLKQHQISGSKLHAVQPDFLDGQ